MQVVQHCFNGIPVKNVLAGNTTLLRFRALLRGIHSQKMEVSGSPLFLLLHQIIENAR
jgi:hypothetical protein